MNDLPVTVAAVRRAAAGIAEAIACTPAIAAPALSELAGTEIHLKIETQHRTGSFKERGALAKLLTLSAPQRRAGVVAMSAGNHAQGVAYHARRLGIPATIVMPLLRDWDFDALITHNRFTLANRNAEDMLNFAHSKGMAVLNAAPYAGGVLAKGSTSYRRYVYQEASDSVLDPIRRIEAICARHGVPPGAAALQFSMRDPRVISTICGVSKPERVKQTLDWARFPIPDALWRELKDVPFSTDDPEATREYRPG